VPINANLSAFLPAAKGIGLNTQTAPKNTTKADIRGLLFQKYLRK
jgi:hypothetical protein